MPQICGRTVPILRTEKESKITKFCGRHVWMVPCEEEVSLVGSVERDHAVIREGDGQFGEGVECAAVHRPLCSRLASSVISSGNDPPVVVVESRCAGMPGLL